MKIYVKKIDDVELPYQACIKDENGNILKTNAAAYDVNCISEPTIVGNQQKNGLWSSIDYIQYETGLFVQPESEDQHILIYPRSSNSQKNVILCNGIGLIDNDYRGQILVRYKYIWQPEDFVIHSDKILGMINTSKIYKKGDRVCQIVIGKTIHVKWEFIDNINQTNRGTGGFNSTIKK